jgi:hypothetical protein
MNKYDLTYISGLFDADPNIIASADIEPILSIDHINQVVHNEISPLQSVMNINNIRYVDALGKVNLYAVKSEGFAAQVGEGEEIPRTKITREKVGEIEVAFRKHRKTTTGEAIALDGYDHAVYETDEKAFAMERAAITKAFYDNLALGTGTAAAGANLQVALANATAALSVKNEDAAVTPIYVVNTNDLYNYLGTANITMQTAMGFTYLKDFLGLGDVLVTGKVASGTVYATCKENLHAVAPARGGDLAKAMGFTTDESGLLLVKHVVADGIGSLETFLWSGVVFYAEDLSNVFKATISA